MSPLLIRPRAVWLDPPGRFERCAVRVAGGEIVALEAPDARAAEIIDLPDLYLLPGLINTHVHLEFSASSLPLAEYLREPPEERLLRAVGNAHRMLLSGVTTVRDCGSHWAALALARRPDLAPLPLPRLLMSGPPITQRSGHLHMMGGEADTPAEILALVERLVAAGAGSLKAMASGGGMTPGTWPEAATYDVETLRLIADAARERRLPSAAHALAAESVRRAALARFDSIEHCAFFVRDAAGRIERRYDEPVARILAGSGAVVMAGLSTASRPLEPIRRRGPATADEAFRLEQFDRLLANFRDLAALGVPMVCGSDAGVRDTPFEETWLEHALMMRAGLPAVDAIRAASTRAAAALRIDDRVGRIAPGFGADLVAIARDPLEEPEAFAAVPFVMSRGHVVRRPEA
jgi:imidazolonepropionase-like amidohydrolase